MIKRGNAVPENKVYNPSYLGLLPNIIPLGIISLVFFPFMMVTIPIFIIMYLSIKVTSYELREDGLFIKKGIIAKKQILLLYTQIQDVTEYQGLWDQIIGLKKLQIKTMTKTSALAGNLSRLTDKDADELKQGLMQRVNDRSQQNKGAVKTTAKYDIKNEQDEKATNPYPLHFIRIGIIYAIFLIIIVIVLGILAAKIQDSETRLNIIMWIIILMSVPIKFLIDQYTFKYWVSENTITIKSGWINTQKTSIEYDKVQDVVLLQGIFQRILGLANIHIETGSATLVAANQEDKRVPNYTILHLRLSDAKILTDKIMKKAGMNYTPQAKPLVEQIPLSGKKVMKKTISGLIGLLIVVGIGIAILWILASRNEIMPMEIFNKIMIWTGIVGAILTIWTVIYQKMYYDRYFYDWSKDTLTIKKGVIGRQQIFLRFDRIQNVFRDQDILDRIFDIYDVHVSTVGDSSVNMCHIDGLTKDNSDRMLAVLMRQVKANM